jgi:hypothetical protein
MDHQARPCAHVLAEKGRLMQREKIVALAKARHLEIEPSSASVVRLVQRQDLEIDIEVEDNQPRSIGGGVRHLQWQNLEDLAEVLRQALAHAGVHSPEHLRSDLSVACVAGKWSPVADVWLSTGAMTDDVKEKTARVVELALAEMTMPSKDQKALFDVGLDEETVQAVRDCVTAALETKGGKVMCAQISAYVAGEQVTSVGGRTRSKPDKSDFTVVPVEMRGRLSGFELGREALFFQPQGGTKIEIHIGKLKVDLVEIARLAETNADVCLRLHRTSDRKGTHQYAYVTLLPGQESGA